MKFKKADAAVRREEVRRGGRALRRRSSIAIRTARTPTRRSTTPRSRYENVKRFAAATQLYERIVTDYPNSKFVDDALFRTAVSYQKAFEFDKAASSYLRLAEDKRFANSPHRTDALYNAAVILENDQNYAKAAELFKRYSADKGVKREDASDAFFRAGVNLREDQGLRQGDQDVQRVRQDLRHGSEGQASACSRR